MKTSILSLAIIYFFCFSESTSYSQTSNWLWAKNVGGEGYESAKSLIVDDSGNIYLAGRFSSKTIIFNSYYLINEGTLSFDALLAKYDADGNVLWAKSAGGINDDLTCSIAMDTAGNIYWSGYFDSPNIKFGIYNLTNAGLGSYDAFLAKYDANGNVLWAKSVGGINDDVTGSVAVDASGNLYWSGYFESPAITFGSYTLTNVGTNSDDAFLAKYNADGIVLWAKSAGGINDDVAGSVAVDASRNVYWSGYFESPAITFGSYTLTNVGIIGGDIFLTKYDADGNVLWAKSAGGTDMDDATSISIDAIGNIYLSGYFDSPVITFGSDILTNSGTNTYDIFLVKYDVIGDVLWARKAGGTKYDVAYSVTIDASGNPYIAGGYSSQTITFGSDTLINAGTDSGDIFLTKYDTNGSALWAIRAGNEKSESALSIATDASENIYLLGYFYSPAITFGSNNLTNTGISDIFLAKLGNSTGIDESVNLSNISVFPNPTSDILMIKILGGVETESKLTIVNITGQQIIKRQITEAQTVLDVSGLNAGIYFVKVISGDGVKVGKFVKE